MNVADGPGHHMIEIDRNARQQELIEEEHILAGDCGAVAPHLDRKERPHAFLARGLCVIG